jgi:hypothetical protein
MHRLALGCAVAALAILSSGVSAQTPPPGGATYVQKKTADGHPDLSGTWQNDAGVTFIASAKDAKGNICVINCPGAKTQAATGKPVTAPPPRTFPKYKPELLDRVAQLRKEQVKYDPALKCGNPGLPRIGPPMKIVQTGAQLIFLYDDLNGSFWRIVNLNKPHREDAEQSLFGDSVGKWEGDTMVIETTSFNDVSWLTDNGAFHTENMKVVERIRPGAEGLEYQATVYDPEVLAEPWQMRLRKMAPARAELLESPPCVEMSIGKMTGDESFHDNPR